MGMALFTDDLVRTIVTVFNTAAVRLSVGERVKVSETGLRSAQVRLVSRCITCARTTG